MRFRLAKTAFDVVLGATFSFAISVSLSAAAAASLNADQPNTNESVAQDKEKPSPGAVQLQQNASLKPMSVVVSVPPLKGLIEGLLPERSTVEILIPPGVSEHGYEIPPAKCAALVNADLVVTVGLGLEPQVKKMLNDRPRQNRIEIEFASLVDIADKHSAHDDEKIDRDHSHCNHDEHNNCSHAGATDPHLWLDPVLAKSFVTKLADRLNDHHKKITGKDVTAEASLRKAQIALFDRLDKLDAAYTEAVRNAKNTTIVVGHDAYGQLAGRYGFTTVPLAGLHASEPTPAAIRKAVETVKSSSVKIIFAEPQLNQSAIEKVAKMTGAEVAMLDPLGDGDYFKMMESNLDALKRAFAGEAAGDQQR